MDNAKICKGCGRRKVLSEFYKNNTYTDGVSGKCKRCISAYQKQYRTKKSEELKEYRKKYYEENRDQIRFRQSKYYQQNKNRVLERAAKYRDAHREEIRGYFRERYKNNREEILDKQKIYSEKHREKKKQYSKTYYRENKERLARQNYERQRGRIKDDPIYKLKRQVGLLIWRSFNQRGYAKPAHSEEILGCTKDFFTKHLKQTWLSKYGTEWNGQPCHIDHIIPLATAKTREEVTALCHYTNLRLLTPEDNMKKGSSLEHITNNIIIEEGK